MRLLVIEAYANLSAYFSQVIFERLMMRLSQLLGTTFLLLSCLLISTGYAAEAEHSVVIEVVTNDMTADKVEESIATPIELLMSNLTDVLLISAKYQDNEAEITIKFNQYAAAKSGLVDQVRKVLDDNTNKLPENIVTLSVSLASLLPANSHDKIREAPVRSYAGNYLGHIQSSNELLPIITTFFEKKDQVATSAGSYSMNEANQVVRGNVFNCKTNFEHTLDCYWQDKYGSGKVAFTFSDDYKNFAGQWSVGEQLEKFKWTGVEVSVD